MAEDETQNESVAADTGAEGTPESATDAAANSGAQTPEQPPQRAQGLYAAVKAARAQTAESGGSSASDSVGLWVVAGFVAVCIDLIGLLDFTVVGAVIVELANIAGWLIMYVLFKLLGVKNKEMRVLLTGLIEIIPFVNVLPSWTLLVVVSFVLAKLQIDPGKLSGTLKS